MPSGKPRVLLALDKFRGSLSATEACESVAAGIHDIDPDIIIDQIMVADGGEGTLEAYLAAGYELVPVGSAPQDVIDAASGWYASDGSTAVIELAALGGLAAATPNPQSALRSTSDAIGQAILSTLDSGHTSIILALGGSASTDGGAGMMHALGLRMLNARGKSLVPGLDELREVSEVRTDNLDPRLKAVAVTVAADVDSPLLGSRGAAVVFGPQKGADPSTVVHLEERLAAYAAAAVSAVPVDHRNTPGAGAAGGVGFSALSFLGATIRPGIDLILEMQHFPERAALAHLVVTGEGSLDSQSLRGKAPVGVSRRAAASGVPVVAVVGRCRLTPEEERTSGFAAVYALEDLEPDPARSIQDAAPLIRRLGQSIALDHLLTTSAVHPVTPRTES